LTSPMTHPQGWVVTEWIKETSVPVLHRNLGEVSPFFLFACGCGNHPRCTRGGSLGWPWRCAPTAKRDHGSPCTDCFLRWVFETCEPCKVGDAVQRAWFCWATRLNTPILEKLLVPASVSCRRPAQKLIGCGRFPLPPSSDRKKPEEEKKQVAASRTSPRTITCRLFRAAGRIIPPFFIYELSMT
jgi:hypothetical protein